MAAVGTLMGDFLLARWAVLLLIVAAPIAGRCEGKADAAHYWIGQTLAEIVKYQQNPLRAARSLAIVAVTLNEAAARAADNAEGREISQHAAAGTILDYLYPQESPAKHRAIARFLSAQLASTGRRGEAMRVAWQVGEEVGARVMARTREDGADRVLNPAARPADAPGRWRAAPPLNVYAPTEPLAGTWRTWVVADLEHLPVPAPPAYDTPEYWREVKQVWEVTRDLTPGQKKLADDWHLDKGSVTPAGVWNRHMLDLLRDSNYGTTRIAKVLAAVNVAMYDALVAAWHVKYRYWTMRPVTAIRQRYDPDFLPYLITPAFPAYVSGHGCVSGAAAEVLGHYFPERAQQLEAMAQAAADSRLYGGIHFRSDNEEGLRLGRHVGRIMVEMLERNGEEVSWMAE